jgi:hypothetical protein
VSRARSGSKTRGESADSPLTTMPENSHAGTLLGVIGYQESYHCALPRRPATYQGLAGDVRFGTPKSGRCCGEKATIFVGGRRYGLTFPSVRGRPIPAWVPGRIRPALKGSLNMKLVRTAGLFLAVTAALVPGCGSKSRRPQHGARSATAAPRAEPTPDTTPIEALRTPAGLVLKIETQTPSGPLRGPTEGGGNVSPAPSPSKP